MRITCLIAEDELPQLQELHALLGELWPELHVVAECSDGLAALEAIEKLHPQVAFLDIRMPGVSGLEVAKAAAQYGQVIFTTAYEQYALQAFEAGAADYVLKPVERGRLRQVIERVRSRLPDRSHVDIAALVNALQAQLSEKRNAMKWVTASVGTRVRLYPIDDVLFFQAQDKYTRVATAREDAQIRTPLKDLLPALDPDVFWQVHRSVIVRVSAIALVERDEDGKLRLSLRDRAETLPVSSAFQHRFRGM